MPEQDSKAMVQKLWDFCDILRDDGLSYGDYLEQLTYLLFLKMADEQHRMLNGDRIVPPEYDWQSLLNLSGAELESHYSAALAALGTSGDILGVIFHKARNRIQKPATVSSVTHASGLGIVSQRSKSYGSTRPGLTLRAMIGGAPIHTR